MTNPKENTGIEAFFERAPKWREEFQALRRIVLACGLNEELKWGKPCYTYHDANIVLIHGFKEYCALLFIKGALLDDKSGLLVQQTENVQAARQIRFTGLAQIAGLEEQIKAYIHQAIEAEKAGLEVPLKKQEDFMIPAELESKMKEVPALKAAFEALTPGRQRGYFLYFSQPKQEKTRAARVEKCIPQILAGKGLED